MSNVLITGGNGFIGRNLRYDLSSKGAMTMILGHEWDENLEAYEKAIIKFNPHYIFHLSAYGNMSTHKEADKIFEANMVNTYYLLRATKDINYKAFVNVSTSSVLLPHQTLYSATKMGAEALCKSFVDEYDKPIVTARPYSVYGPGEAVHRFIPTVFRSCMTGEPMTLDPDATHDWTYIDDIVRGLINTAMNIELFKGKAISLGTGFSYTNAQVVQVIEDITGKRAMIEEVKKMRSFDTDNWVSNTPAGEYLKLRDGLTRYYESLQ